MTAEQLAQLREVAERAAWGNWQAYKPHKGARGYEVKNGVEAVAQHCIKHDAGFIASANPKTVLALLDELERVTAERDALREGEMGDAKHSDTRSAADIYFQLVEECEIPHGGSLVEHIDAMRDRIAELEARTVTVKPPAYVDGNTLGYGEVNHMIDLCVDAFERACHVAGINLTVEV